MTKPQLAVCLTVGLAFGFAGAVVFMQTAISWLDVYANGPQSRCAISAFLALMALGPIANAVVAMCIGLVAAWAAKRIGLVK
jgi:hypothetical protein